MSSRTGAVGFGAFLLICAAAVPVTAQQKRPMTFQDLAAMHRLSGPQISPDGKWIAYEVGTPNLEANRVVRDIWLVSAEGGEARQITRGGSDTRPRWSPDGKRIAFLSSRDGEQQVYWITSGWRRCKSADVAFRWRGHRVVVARRKMDCVCFECLSRLQRRGLQRGTQGATRKKQGEGENL